MQGKGAGTMTTYLPEKDKQLIEINAVVKFHARELIRQLENIRLTPGTDIAASFAFQTAQEHARSIKNAADEIYEAI
jgi:hypothetical protein